MAGKNVSALDPPNTMVGLDSSTDPGFSNRNSLLDNLCGTGKAVCEVFPNQGVDAFITTLGDQHVAGGTQINHQHLGEHHPDLLNGSAET